MCAVSEERLSYIVEKVAAACMIREWRYVHQNFESKAQNYFGIIMPIQVTGLQNEEEVALKVVLKLAPTDERYRVSGAVTLMFSREIFVYSSILKRYQNIQENFSTPSQYIIPRCYFVCQDYCQEVIAMQDMCGDGYKPYTNTLFLDLDHMIISLKALAKFHALSFILRNRDMKAYEEITEVCVPLNEKTNERFFFIMIDRLSKALQKFENTSYVPILECLKRNCVKHFDAAVELVEDTCVCHGDIWKENILFKYQDNKPISACLIDYQTTRMISPAFDTLYLITCNTTSELRQEHYYNLLDIYYQTFEQTLHEAGLKCHEIYSRQMFDADLKTVGPSCFITANTALWLFNGLQQEGHVRSKQVFSTKEEEQQAVNNYMSIIKAIIKDYYQYGYFCDNMQ